MIAHTRRFRRSAAVHTGRPVALAVLAGLGLSGCAPGALTLTPGLLAGVVLGSAALNALAVGAMLLLWDRLTRRRRERAHLLRELRYLRHWPQPEGVLRKTGLLRDLNALGVERMDLEGAVLAGADLKGLRLRQSSLRGAALAGADLQGASLVGCDLFGADLAGANLERATLQGTDLRGADLHGASLARAELERANLRRANLVDANIHAARLDGAHLERARFAERQAGLFQPSVHPSVEDWIRERLDTEGAYRGDEEADDEADDGA